jgi:hypothetical protein
MRYLKIYEEFESSSDFNERSDYVIDLRDNIKEILLPFTDDGLTVSLPNGTMIGMIANVLYSNEYLVSYNDFYKSVMDKDLKSLSDLLYVSIDLPMDKWITKLTHSLRVPYYKLPEWILDCFYHLESYMVSEGFKLEIKLYNDMTGVYPAFGKHLNPSTTDFNSVSELEKFEADKKITSIRIGFNI